MDGNYQGSVTTDDNGEASYTVQRTVSYSVTSTKKTYVKNWNDLSKSQQKEATDNGWYDSSAKAYAVAMQEAQKLADHSHLTIPMNFKRVIWRSLNREL